MTSSPPSLKVILASAFGLLLLLLVVLLSFTVEFIAIRQFQQDAQTLLVTLAHEMSNRLDYSLFERYREVIVWSETQVDLLEPTTSNAERRTLLESWQQTYPDYAWLGLADPGGRVIAAANGQLEGQDVSQQPWFQRGRTAPYIGEEPDTLRSTGDVTPNVVVIAAPVYASTGELIGVLGVYLGWTWAQDAQTALLRSTIGDGQEEVFIVDQQENVLFGPTGWINRHLTLPSVAAARRQQEAALLETWPDDKRYVTGFAPTQGYRDFPSLGWMVLVRQPVAQAYALAQRMRWLIVAAGSLCALLFTAVIWLMATRITRQLQAITSAADRIRHGEENVIIPRFTGSAEVATLSATLNQLIEELTTATTAERNRIARDLHDSVTQTLFSAAMVADVLPKVWAASPERGQVKLEELRRAVRGALAEMRTLLLELRPAALIDTEMERLLRQLADATSGRSAVAVSWQIEGFCTLQPNVKVAIYRTVQEALSNVVKHAGANQATIRLQCNGQQVVLTIHDDGCGFEQSEITGDHFGLKMMRERIQAIGGSLHIQSRPEQGTEITVLWPNGQS